jgi:diaminopimelate epimerase
MQLPFVKMNGAGNDFVMLDNRDLSLSLTGSNRSPVRPPPRRGAPTVCCWSNQPPLAGTSKCATTTPMAVKRKCVATALAALAAFVNHLHGDTLSLIHFETLAGMISAEFEGDQVRINMSTPFDLKLNQTLPVAGETLTVHSINTGVPHAVVFFEDVEPVAVRPLGAGLRYHEAFAPKGTNANFVQVLSPNSIRIRTYERGVEDETLACGTGMVACALIHHELTGAPSPIQVKVQGGDTLAIGFVETAPHAYSNVTLFGPADFAFTGSIEI